MLSEGYIIGVITVVVGLVGGLFILELRRLFFGAAGVNAPTTSFVAAMRAIAIVTIVVGSLFVWLQWMLGRNGRTRGSHEDGGTSASAPSTGTGSILTVTATRNAASPPAPAASQPLETMEVRGCVFVKMPTGKCLIGCTPRDPDCSPGEPAGVVRRFDRTFYVMRAEVTESEYAACVAAGGCERSGDTDRRNVPVRPLRPVVNVDAFDAQRFCAWVGGRLPGEREWEYAARGGESTFRYPWGMEFDVDKVASRVGDGPADVMTKPPNKFGLYDMSGNVSELTVGPVSAIGKPTIAVRGGSYESAPPQLRVSYRVVTDFHHFGNTKGFRCVVDLEAGKE